MLCAMRVPPDRRRRAARHWQISIDPDADLSDRLVLDLCDMSYDLVFSKLPKRVQREIAGA